MLREASGRGPGQQGGGRVVLADGGQVPGAPLEPLRVAGRTGRQRRGRAPVHQPDEVGQRRLQDGVPYESMTERQGPARGLQQPDPRAVGEGVVDDRGAGRRDGGEQTGVEVARDGSGRHHVAVGAPDAVQAGAHHLADGPRHPGRPTPPHRPGVADLERARREVRVQDFLHVQREPVAARDVGDEGVGRARPEQRRDEQAHLAGAEAAQREDVRAAVAKPPHEGVRDAVLVGPQHTGDGRAGDLGRREVTHRLEALGVGGVQVVQEEQRAAVRRRDLPDEMHDTFEGQEPPLAWREI